MKHDGLHKRGSRWYFWMRINGKPTAVSTGTGIYQRARAIRSKRLSDARAGVLFPSDLTFRAAVSEWGIAAERTLAAVTFKCMTSRLRRAVKFFGSDPLGRVTPERVLRFRALRLQAARPQSVNIEMHGIRAVMRHFFAWGPQHADAIKPLKPVAVSGRASRRRLTLEEIARLRAVAASRWQWKQMNWAAELGLHTGMRSAEIRGLRMGDIELTAAPPRLCVRRATTKTAAGERVVLLFPGAIAAIRELLKIARERGACQRYHFLFPEPKGKTWNPCRPTTRWPGAWKTICKRAGLREVRFHDLRHTYITSAAESGAPIDSTMRQVGHLNPRDTRGYTQVSDRMVYESLEKVSLILSAGQ